MNGLESPVTFVFRLSSFPSLRYFFGFIAIPHLMNVLLCFSTDREVEERRHDLLQEQSI
jgi:hypothetical protein